MRGQATVAVIGHVDHGKTSLVRALTGTDTDRLPEEKSRGLSIVPGYAWIEADDRCVDLVDVPGHEQFVRMMVAGATGIDAVLLAIDGREGPKPQTREHLAIARLLGVARGVIAVTKTDRMTDGERRAAVDWVRGLVRDGFLRDAPIVLTSAVTGEGLGELSRAVLALAQGGRDPPAPAKAARASGATDSADATSAADAGHDGVALVAVDRAFAVPGAGTVVTGTLQFGPLRVGDRLRWLPDGRELLLRRLQVHGRDVGDAVPGQRVGLNLRGAAHHELRRGDVIAGRGGSAAAGTLLDVEVVVEAGARRPLVDGDRLRLLIGTAETTARLRLLDAVEVVPGQVRYAQLLCERSVACVAQQPFVLRASSPAATVGGGRVLEIASGRHRRTDAGVLRRLSVLAHGDAAAVLELRVAAAGPAGVAIDALAQASGLFAERLAGAVDASERLERIGRRAYDRAALQSASDRIAEVLQAFHAAQPAMPGMPVARLRTELPGVPDGESLAAILCHAERRGRLVLEAGMLRLPEHDPLQAIGAAGRAKAAAIEAAFREGGLAPPDLTAVLRGDARADAIVRLLVQRGVLVRVAAGPGLPPLAFHHDALAQARGRLRTAWPPPAQFTLSQARELLGSTRKYVVPLMEYLDAQGFTLRRGDRRTIAPTG